MSSPVIYDNVNSIAFYCVSWGSPYVGTAGQGGDIRDCGEFNSLATVFNFWKVMGLKIKVFPGGNFSGSTNLVFYHTQIASFGDA